MFDLFDSCKMVLLLCFFSWLARWREGLRWQFSVRAKGEREHEALETRSKEPWLGLTVLPLLLGEAHAYTGWVHTHTDGCVVGLSSRLLNSQR